MSNLVFITAFLICFGAAANGWGDSQIYPPTYSIFDTVKMKDPLAINTTCTLRDTRYNIRESFKDALEKDAPYSKGTSPLNYTILEYHIEIINGHIYYCYIYTDKDNVVR